MTKKLIPIFIIISLFVGYPVSTFATTSPAVAKTSVSATKSVAKKVVKKKKVVAKKKEKLIINPPLITLDNAPHSAKKVTVKKKVVAKKPLVAIRKK